MSNANVAGMSKELSLAQDDRYSIALLMFFVPYFIFELPSNIVLRKVGAAVWLSTIVLAWGVVMIGMGFVKNWVQLTILRTVLGLFEAGSYFLSSSAHWQLLTPCRFLPRMCLSRFLLVCAL